MASLPGSDALMRAMHAADAKREFRQILDAAERGEETVVLRRGKPVAVIAPLQKERSRNLPEPRRPGGLLSIVGLFDTWDTMEQDMAEVVAERQDSGDRPQGRG